ncbi:DUF1853 family protein [Winogradskyella endarachnes]|uniref:DUF1853 family protein n=1 Tax=Winogradskyella endarachnes TaxID=2681965 RepID=A0A6L6U4L6_9FLAO|nr:DUF1853 family protein [Winogradskyella endarachnes]MUU77033.1 DUF1853 family protein [Winogradskyella endarachnes]
MKTQTILRYKGYLETPSLFVSENIIEYEILQLQSTYNDKIDPDSFKNNRLGKLVEEFVFHQLKKKSEIKIVSQNLQIQNGKQTIGELDLLYYANELPIHLEIVYKFYLYDSLKHYSNPLFYWICPNRKDTLDYKLEKLKRKQFPLLYTDQTKLQLKKLGFTINNIKQQLCFKAQLFLPYYNKKINVTPLNKACISGFYSSYKTISEFDTFQFYIPDKLDWLIKPHNNVEWLTFNNAKSKIDTFINTKKSPLVWLKGENKEIIKCFITWW